MDTVKTFTVKANKDGLYERTKSDVAHDWQGHKLIWNSEKKAFAVWENNEYVLWEQTTETHHQPPPPPPVTKKATKITSFEIKKEVIQETIDKLKRKGEALSPKAEAVIEAYAQVHSVYEDFLGLAAQHQRIAEAHHKAMVETADQYKKVAETFLKKMIDLGLITEDEYNKIMFPNIYGN